MAAVVLAEVVRKPEVEAVAEQGLPQHRCQPICTRHQQLLCNLPVKQSMM
jgi:hypothetical protein